MRKVVKCTVFCARGSAGVLLGMEACFFDGAFRTFLSERAFWGVRGRTGRVRLR